MEAERIRRRKWKSLKERLSLMGCCASGWGFRASNPTTITINDEEEAEGYGIHRNHREEQAEEAGSGEAVEMNLAAALAAERQYRAISAAADERLEQDEAEGVERVSLMRLLEEGEENRGGGGDGWCWCCVCMGRRKGAAFIPCGHTFCRVCAREMWVNRGSCPLCNRPIVDILDIF